MGAITTYICNVCGEKISIDAGILLCLTLTYRFNRVALDAPWNGPVEVHVCPHCYPTAMLWEITGVKPEDTHFYMG